MAMDEEEKAAYERGLAAGNAELKEARLKALEEKGKKDAKKGGLVQQGLSVLKEMVMG